MHLRATMGRHRDVLIAVILAVGYAVELLLYPGSDLAIALPLAVAAGLALALRRRAPLAIFLVVSILNFAVVHWAAPGFDGKSIVFVAIFVFNLYSLGANARDTEGWLGVLAVAATVVAFLVGDGSHGPADVFFAATICGLPWGAGVVIRLRGERERELQARNLALEQEAVRAVAAERARIARELHDVVSHAIAVSVLQARGGAKMVGRDDDSVLQALAAIERTNTAALADMRRLLALLRDADIGPPDTEPQPSLERLPRLVEQVRESGLPVELAVTGDPLPLPPGLDLSAYRIIQEALTNVLKHAGSPARAWVELTYGADGLDLAVRNSGTTPDRVKGAGQGLIGIRERVEVAGGSVDVGPQDGGYAVRARLPYLGATS
jgi:signal transduction histidine kinase